MHCQQGEKFVHALGTWECLEGVQIGLAIFEQFGAGPVSWGGLTAPRRLVAVQAV
jgi:hypothetical protein